MGFHFSAGEAKQWLTENNQTLTKSRIFDLIQENNGLYAFKGRGNYIAGANFNQHLSIGKDVTIQYDLRLDSSIWADKSTKQVHEDDSALLKVFGSEFDNQNVKTTTPYLLQFGPVYDYIDGEEFSKIVLEFETADSYKIFKKSISISKSLTYDKPHTLSVTLGKDSYSMHIDDVQISSGKIASDFFSSSKQSSQVDESSSSVKELRAMKEKLSTLDRLIEDPYNFKPANATSEWTNDKFVENPEYQKLWTSYQQKRREMPN